MTSDQQVEKASAIGKTNAAKMGEWHTASHIERQAKKKKNEAPANPPAPKS